VSDGTNSDSTAQPSRFGEFLRELATFLDGRKTYIVAAGAILYLVGADAGCWEYNDQVLAICGFGGLAALRKGLNKKPV